MLNIWSIIASCLVHSTNYFLYKSKNRSKLCVLVMEVFCCSLLREWAIKISTTLMVKWSWTCWVLGIKRIKPDSEPCSITLIECTPNKGSHFYSLDNWKFIKGLRVLHTPKYDIRDQWVYMYAYNNKITLIIKCYSSSQLLKLYFQHSHKCTLLTYPTQ